MKSISESGSEFSVIGEVPSSAAKLRLMCVTMCLSVFSTNLVSSMCAPFYPKSASHHGLDSDVTGSILGVYYASTVFASPFMAVFMTKIGQSNLLQFGLFLVGISSFVFGGIDHLGDGISFGVISFVLRALQGVGCAATDTAVFAIASSRFKKDLGKVNSYINSAMGISFMLGPPVGGFLYSWTNFSLPFMFSAILCFMSIAMINVVFRHLRESKLAEEDHTVSPMLVLRKSGQLLSNLRFVWILITAMFGVACTSFLDPTLSPYLSAMGFNNTAYIGAFYMLRDVSFTIGTPPVGTLIDSFKWNPNVVLAIGAIIAGIGYNLIGIGSYLIPGAASIRVGASLVLIGAGQAPVFSATLPAMVEEAKSQGLKQDDETCAILAALQNFAFYGGLWAGSVISGAVTYYYGFAACTAVFGASVIVVALIHVNVYVFCSKNTTYHSLNSAGT